MKLLTLASLIYGLTLDVNNLQAVTQATKRMKDVMMGYYYKDNTGGHITTSEVKDETGFQWFEGGIFWQIAVEYMRVTGDLNHANATFTGLALGSNLAVGSFLGRNPALASLSGKWNDDIRKFASPDLKM